MATALKFAFSKKRAFKILKGSEKFFGLYVSFAFMLVSSFYMVFKPIFSL